MNTGIFRSCYLMMTQIDDDIFLRLHKQSDTTMDIPIEINNLCFHCSVKMNNTQAVQLMPCCRAVCVWCMIEQQQQTKEDHVMTCYCKQAVVSHAFKRPVAGGQI